MTRKGVFRECLVLLLCAAGTAYFSYHAFAGRHGLEARWRLTTEFSNAEIRLRDLETARSYLERDIALLQDNNLDPDMLDQQARSVIGFAQADELIVLQR